MSRSETNPSSVTPVAPPRFEPAFSRTLLDLLRQRALSQPDGHVLRFISEDGEKSSLTYRELDRQARAIAAVLQEQAFAGQRVLLIYPAGLDFIVAFFGCVYANVLAVPATHPKPRRPMARIATIADDCHAALALTLARTIRAVDNSSLPARLREVTWLATDEISPTRAEKWQDPGLSEDTVAFLQYTSGSTSNPKGVMITHRNLMSNLEMIRRAFGIDGFPGGDLLRAGVSWLPPHHDMGLIGSILETIYVGGCSVLMSPSSFLKRPVRWLQAITEHRAVVSGAPNFAYELCLRKVTPQQRRKLDLSSWRVAFCGAEPVQADTLTAFSETFKECGFRKEAFYPCYGLAEATLLVAGGDSATAPRTLRVNRSRLRSEGIAEPCERDGTAQTLVSCGRSVRQQRLLVVDPISRTRCPDGKVGEVWLAGPNIAGGYWNGEHDNAAVFAARVTDDGDGTYLRTGDLGFLFDDELYITGRLKELLIVRGRNHYPYDLELTAQRAHACLLPGAGAAFSVDTEGGEQVVLVQEVGRAFRGNDLNQVIQDIRREVVEEHDVELNAIVLIRQASLPRTTSGKLQRRQCRRQYLGGRLRVLAEWTRPATDSLAGSPQDRFAPLPPVFQNSTLTPGNVEHLADHLETQLLEWLRDRCGVAPDQLDRERPFAELGIDSLSAVELIAELESWSGLQLSSVAAWKYPTPAALARYLARELGQVAGGAPSPDADQETSGDGDLERLLAEVEHMSEDDVTRVMEDGGLAEQGDGP